jgi:hypothetical protein
MLKGCFRNIFALIGCFTVLVVLGFLGWQYRAQVTGLVRSFTAAED